MTGEVFLETERLRLRRFTADDADLLVVLDADPDVMFFINAGVPTPRAEIVDEVLPAFFVFIMKLFVPKEPKPGLEPKTTQVAVAAED